MSAPRASGAARVGLALALAGAAGAVDAVAFTELHELFASFMSGNSTRLGVELAQGAGRSVGPIAGTIALFVAGAFAGTGVADAAGRWGGTAVVAAEALILGGTAAAVGAGLGPTPLYAIAFAMGGQNAVHPTVAGAGIGKSFVTGTLFGVGQALARGLADPTALGASLANLLSWAAFVAGAIGGTALLARIGTAPTLAGVAAALAVLALLLLPRGAAAPVPQGSPL